MAKKTEAQSKQTFLSLSVHAVEGDILTSKNGFLMQSPLTDKFYTCKKIQVLGKNHFVVLGEKEPIKVSPVK